MENRELLLKLKLIHEQLQKKQFKNARISTGILIHCIETEYENGNISDFSNQRKQLSAFELYYHEEYGENIVSGSVDCFLKHI